MEKWLKITLVVTGVVATLIIASFIGLAILISATGGVGSWTENQEVSQPAEKAEQAPEKPKKWQKVTSISGNADKKTDVFKLTGGKVKAEYSTTGGEFNDAYMSLKDTYGSSEDIATTSGNSKDSTFLYPEAGEYYLEVSVANNTKYSLVIYEYK